MLRNHAEALAEAKAAMCDERDKGLSREIVLRQERPDQEGALIPQIGNPRKTVS